MINYTKLFFSKKIFVGNFPSLGKKCRPLSIPGKNSFVHFPALSFGNIPTLHVYKIKCPPENETFALKRALWVCSEEKKLESTNESHQCQCFYSNCRFCIQLWYFEKNHSFWWSRFRPNLIEICHCRACLPDCWNYLLTLQSSSCSWLTSLLYHFCSELFLESCGRLNGAKKNYIITWPDKNAVLEGTHCCPSHKVFTLQLFKAKPI